MCAISLPSNKSVWNADEASRQQLPTSRTLGRSLPKRRAGTRAKRTEARGTRSTSRVRMMMFGAPCRVLMVAQLAATLLPSMGGINITGGPADGVFHIMSDADVLLEGGRRRRMQAMRGGLEGNVMPLGYFYTRLHIGTPGQVFTVIVDTGSSLTA